MSVENSLSALGIAEALRSYLDASETLAEEGAIIVEAPGDPLTLYVIRKGGDHLMVQVNAAEMVIR